jgi:hypothetical protein
MMTIDEFLDAFDQFTTDAPLRMYPNGPIRAGSCCPIECLAGTGPDTAIDGAADFLGLSPIDRGVVMDAADYGLNKLESGVARRIRRRLLAKVRREQQ